MLDWTDLDSSQVFNYSFMELWFSVAYMNNAFKHAEMIPSHVGYYWHHCTTPFWENQIAIPVSSQRC